MKTPLKSHALQQLWIAIAEQFETTNAKTTISFVKYCGTDTTRFLCQTLPNLGKIVDKGLELGRIPEFSGLFRKKKGTELPVFMHEYLSKIFYADNGYIQVEFDQKLLKEFRTLCYMFYKLELPFTKEQESIAYKKFVDLDQSVKTDFDDIDISSIRTTFSQCLPDDPMDIRPRHSSGATADGVCNINKRIERRYIPSLMGLYGPEYFFLNDLHKTDWFNNNQMRVSEPSSKVTLVPKDSRGPRIICMEPHERMFIQKGLMHKIYDHIEKYSPHRGRINFTDQSINQRLAYTASITQEYATIDMKDASDLVSWELIKRLVPIDWLYSLEASRTPLVRVPPYGIENNDSFHELKKFAPMGSALCFPIEAILFYSIAKEITPEVWVYGDDIIVPTQCVEEVMELLEQFGLIVNRDKSLYRGFFRESCGGDYYKGYNINPVRCKSLDLDSFVAFANLLRMHHSDEAGLAAVRWFESINQRPVLRLPYHNYCVNGQLRPSSLIAYYTDGPTNECLFRRRWNKDLQRYEFRSLGNRSRTVRVISNNYDALFDWFTNKETSNAPIEDRRIEDIIKGVTYDSDSTPSHRSVSNSTNSLISSSKKEVSYLWGESKIS